MPQPINQYPTEAPLSTAWRGEGGEVSVIGGGLAGLSLSILLARQGRKVCLFEKNTYPFHRVCGEYISLESKPFLESLGLAISPLKYPHINRLQVTAVSGVTVNRPLDLGGFGISRYLLDYELSKIAIAAGVTIVHERVEDVNCYENVYEIKTNNGRYNSRLCLGSFGKRSNLDVKLKRPFIQSAAKGLNNYLGIKYHIRYEQPKYLIALHNFSDGYCGISAIEDDKYCLCYLTTANNLSGNGNNVKTMERNVLHRNKQLKHIFENAEFLYDEPLVISQVSFADKEQYASQLLFCGDAAGLITPLCGNGMSMALRAASLLAPLAELYLRNDLSMDELQRQYSQQWKIQFSNRLKLGRKVQSMFGNNGITTAFLQTCKTLPFIADALISRTHGKPF